MLNDQAYSHVCLRYTFAVGQGVVDQDVSPISRYFFQTQD